MSEARDLREGGRWTLAQRVKNDLVYFAAWTALSTLGRLPPRALRALGRLAGKTAHAALRGERRYAERSLALALPEVDAVARRRILATSFTRLGEALGDAVATLGGGAAPRLAWADGSRELLRATLAEGRGCVFVSAHLGPWEQVARTLVADGFPLTTLARASYDPRFTRLYDRLRGGAGVRSIYRGSPGAATGIVRALRRGQLLGVPMDLRSRVPSVEVPFLGRLAPTPVGPARIALRSAAPVVVGTAMPDACGDGTLVIEVTRVTTLDLGADDAAALALTTRINAELSRRVRAFPEGWLWMHRRWREADDPITPERRDAATLGVREV